MTSTDVTPSVAAAEPRGLNVDPRPVTDRFLQWLSRRVLNLFYRQVEVVGLHNLPPRGPVIVVANHTNSLVDGTMVTGFLPRIPRLVAASTVWKYTPLIPFIRMAGVIPIYRRAESQGAARKNRTTFAAATELLSVGGMIAVFPEGESHDEPRVKPLKSGTARLALRAHHHAPPVSILPVGLSYDAKGRFRSRALMELGPPIPVAPFAKNTNEAAASRALTAAIHNAMLDVTQNYENRELARLIGRAAELWEAPDPTLSDRPALAITAERRRDFIQRYDWLRAAHPIATSTAWQAFESYDTELRENGLRDAHIGAVTTPAQWRRHVIKLLSGVLLRAPVAAIGVVLNAVTFLVVQVLALRRDPDKRATWQVFPTLIMAPAVWLLQGLAVGWTFGAGLGLATVIAGLVSIPIALRFSDRANRLFHDLRARRRLARDPDLLNKLQQMRTHAQSQLADLADLVEQMPDPGEEPA